MEWRNCHASDVAVVRDAACVAGESAGCWVSGAGMFDSAFIAVQCLETEKLVCEGDLILSDLSSNSGNNPNASCVELTSQGCCDVIRCRYMFMLGQTMM